MREGGCAHGPEHRARSHGNARSRTSPTVVITTHIITVKDTVIRSTCGFANGKIVAKVTAGTPPYRFVWTNVSNMVIADDTTNSSDSIFNIYAGIYHLIIYDKTIVSGLMHVVRALNLWIEGQMVYWIGFGVCPGRAGFTIAG